MKRLALFIAALAAFAVLGATGCGGASQNVVPVQGTITQNGEPLADVKVRFKPVVAPPDFDAESIAVSDASGRYQIQTGDLDGAPVGAYRVALSKIVDGEETLIQYCRPIDSPLSVEVTPTADATAYDFDLE
ncbi:MAG: hypothetical protein IJE97_00065 [Thermoguttaceae bacterium]|nr:hypothetical protein [Thermoguttaceae bacterium]MBQ7111884.1 hypothetical protein [Thermoguttaceae bacterium]